MFDQDKEEILEAAKVPRVCKGETAKGDFFFFFFAERNLVKIHYTLLSNAFRRNLSEERAKILSFI